MNKGELIDQVSGASGVSKKDVEAVVNQLIDAVQDAVARDEKVTIPGFGAWSRTDRKAREGRNPQTGAPVHIPASKGVKFAPGSQFKARVQ